MKSTVARTVVLFVVMLIAAVAAFVWLTSTDNNTSAPDSAPPATAPAQTATPQPTASPGATITVPDSLTDGIVATADDGSALSVADGPDGALIPLSFADPASTSTEFALAGNFSTAETVGSGAVLLWRTDGTLLGGFFAPQATDATGAAVKADYAVTGATLTVTVHPTATTQFPISANPVFAQDLFADTAMTDNPDGGSRISAWLSPWGRTVYAGDSAGFSTEGWRTLGAAYPLLTDPATIDSLHQQWDCHVLGGWLTESSWDLETIRPPNPDWRDRILQNLDDPEAVCNW